MFLIRIEALLAQAEEIAEGSGHAIPLALDGMMERRVGAREPVQCMQFRHYVP